MNTSIISATTATAISTSAPLTIDELAHLCGTQPEWVIRIVETGILQPTGQNEPAAWRFVSSDIHRALEARELERMLDTNLDAVAMLMDLSHELRRLKNILHAHGISC